MEDKDTKFKNNINNQVTKRINTAEKVNRDIGWQYRNMVVNQDWKERGQEQYPAKEQEADDEAIKRFAMLRAYSAKFRPKDYRLQGL